MESESDIDASPRMAADLRQAWIWAATRTGIGFVLLAALIGIRIIQATPGEDVGASLAGESSMGAEGKASGLDPDLARASENESGTESEAAGSVLSRLADRIPGARAERDEGSRFVSCRLPDGVRFMTAADCAFRNGRATAFEPSER